MRQYRQGANVRRQIFPPLCRRSVPRRRILAQHRRISEIILLNLEGACGHYHRGSKCAAHTGDKYFHGCVGGVCREVPPVKPSRAEVESTVARSVGPAPPNVRNNSPGGVVPQQMQNICAAHTPLTGFSSRQKYSFCWIQLTSQTHFGHSKMVFRPLLRTKIFFSQNTLMARF